LADLLTNALHPTGEKERLPARPQNVTARVNTEGVEVAWSGVPEAQSFRVLRASAEVDDWVWVNSPYRAEKPAAGGASVRFVDAGGHAGSRYVVLSVDRDGRASAWPLDTGCAVAAAP
jgi:hypothetical protein